MKAGLKIFVLSLVLFAIAFATERFLVPDVVPVAFAEQPQPLWSVETAFVLRSIELIAGSVAALSLVFAIGAWVRQRLAGLGKLPTSLGARSPGRSS